MRARLEHSAVTSPAAPAAAPAAPAPLAAPLTGYQAQSAALKPKAPSTTGPFPPDTWLGYGASGPLVLRLQELLCAAGHKVPTTGRYLTQTAGAVRGFQQHNGLLPDSVAGPATLRKLVAVTGGVAAPSGEAGSAPPPAQLTGNPVLKRGARGARVLLLQRRLNHHGADVTEDGDFGWETEGAVRAFRLAHGLGNGGTVGPAVAAALNAGRGSAPQSGDNAYAVRGLAAVEAARTQLNVPYMANAMVPGKAMDCSGLTRYAWGQAGVNLTHRSSIQATETDDVDPGDVQPGDLLFFHSPISHVSMATGQGKHIQAPGTGDFVREGTFTASKVVERGRPRI